jgi:hypothetical protein
MVTESEFRDMLLDLKMEEEATSEGIYTAS